MPRDEEEPFHVVLPHQHAVLVRILHARQILRLALEILEQEAGRSLHPLILNLPQPDLVHHRRRQDGAGVESRSLYQLRMCVCTEVGYYLIGCDAMGDGIGDRPPGETARDHVGVPDAKSGEEGQDSDLKRGVGVCVEPVVGLDYNEALGPAGRRECGVKTSRDASKCTRV
ncbi:unnamed protein product [Diplocarpon coronariae]